MTPGSMIDTFIAGTFWGAWSAIIAFAGLMPRATLRAVEALTMLVMP